MNKNDKFIKGNYKYYYYFINQIIIYTFFNLTNFLTLVYEIYLIFLYASTNIILCLNYIILFIIKIK